MDMISVVVPVYNVEKYLKRCIDSILNQTYGELEIILVDDGSTDSSSQICDEYAEQDSRICVIHKENGGPSDARNLGISKATSEYLAFVDSDDWLAPDIYEYSMNLQKEYHADIVEFGIRRVKDWTEGRESEVEEKIYCSTGKEMLPRIYQNNMGGSITIWNKLYKKDIFQGNLFEKGKIFEDTLLSPKLLYRANIYVVSNKIGYFYYQGNNKSITKQEFSWKNLDAVYAHESNRQFYLDHHLSEPLHWLDTTYAFCMINMMKRIKSTYGKANRSYRELKRKYDSLLTTFLKNPYFLWKQKILLLYYYIIL